MSLMSLIKKMDLAKYSYLGNGKNPWQEPYWYRTTFTLPKQYKNKKNMAEPQWN